MCVIRSTKSDMETLEKLSKASVDQSEFWYVVAIIAVSLMLIFFALTIYFLKRFLDDEKEDKKDMKENLIKLTDIVTRMQENQKIDRRDINKNTDDIDELRKRRRGNGG